MAKKAANPPELVKGSAPHSLETICWFLERFGWRRPPKSSIEAIGFDTEKIPDTELLDLLRV